MSPVFGYAKSTQHSGILNNVTHNFSMEYHYAERQIFYCYADFHYTKCRYAEFRYAECHGAQFGLGSFNNYCFVYFIK